MSKQFDVEKETVEVEAAYGHRLETSEYLSGEELAQKAKERVMERKDELKEKLED